MFVCGCFAFAGSGGSRGFSALPCRSYGAVFVSRGGAGCCRSGLGVLCGGCRFFCRVGFLCLGDDLRGGVGIQVIACTRQFFFGGFFVVRRGRGVFGGLLDDFARGWRFGAQGDFLAVGVLCLHVAADVGGKCEYRNEGGFSPGHG